MNHALSLKHAWDIRAHHVIAVVAVLVVGLGVKQVLFPPRHAEANINAVPGFSMNIMQMHSNIDMKYLPVQRMSDKAFVFVGEE
jgi:hypothetical protein